MHQAVTFVFFINISALIISFIHVINFGNYGGELENFSYGGGWMEASLVFLLVFMAFVLSLVIFSVLRKINIRMIGSSRVLFNYKAFDRFTFVVLLASLVFLALTGVGRLLSTETSPFSTVFNIFNPGYFYSIYYLVRRKSGRNLFWINLVLFSVLSLSKGWTGFVLLIFLFELYYLFNFKFSGRHPAKRYFYVFLPLLLLFVFSIGGILYSFLFSLKAEVRGLGNVEVTPTQGISLLASRLSNYSISLGAFSRMDEVVSYFNLQEVPFKEIVATARPITPGFVFEDKASFTTMNNDVLKPFFPNITNSTSSDTSFLVYSYILFKADPVQFLLYIVFTIFFVFFVKAILDSLSEYKGQLDFLLYLYLNKLFYTSVHEVFTVDFIGLFIFIVPIIFLTGVLRVFRPIPRRQFLSIHSKSTW